MIRFIFRKILYGLLVLFGAVTVVFMLFSIKPGDPARMLTGQSTNEELIQNIRKDLGLDLPLHKRYLLYINDVSPISLHDPINEDSHVYLDDKKYSYVKVISFTDHRTLVLKKPYLRKSYQKKKLVTEIIAETMPETIILAVTAILFASIFGILLGVIAALNKGSFIDNAAMVIAVLGMSAPSFYMAMLIGWLFGNIWREETMIPLIPLIALALGLLYGFWRGRTDSNKITGKFSFNAFFEWVVKLFAGGIIIWIAGVTINGLLGWELVPFMNATLDLPGTGLNQTGTLVVYDDLGEGPFMEWKNLILPAFTLGIRPLAIIVQLTRSSLLDVLSQDYIRTATAKGLKRTRVIFKHALKNALNPVITAVSGWFASLLAGAIFIEWIFGWQGIGLHLFNALITDDLPLVMGGVLVVASVFVVLNMVVDIIYGLLDPRVRVMA